MDRKGVVTTYGYDDLGRLISKSYSDGTTPAASYTYDDAGRLATAANGTDTLTWTYDLAGQLLSEQSSRNGSLVGYGYDAAGNRLSVSLDGQVFVSYGYDDASRLTTITRGADVFGFGYGIVNRRTSMSYPNAVTTSYSYDNLNRLTSLRAVPGGGTTITSFGYTYDAAGNRLTKATPEFTESYGYEPLYRLTGAERTGSLSGLWHFGYDGVGNRTTAQTGNSVLTSAYNEKNQLLSSSGGGALKVRGVLDEPGTAKVNGQPAQMLAGNTFEATIQTTPGVNTFTVEATDVSGNVTAKSYQIDVSATGASYSYDPNGNLTSKTEGSNNWVYTWDAKNRLTQVQNNGNTVATFAYDPLGRRVQKVAGGVTTSYSYAASAILRELRGTTTLKYVHGPGIDEPLASDDGTALSYFHADALGSIAKLTSAAGTATLARQYDAWGNLQAGADQPDFAFTGREWEPETGLYYYRARYLDPSIGRFVSEDPIGLQGGINFFAYVSNRPTTRIDPLGLIEMNLCSSLRDPVPQRPGYPPRSLPNVGLCANAGAATTGATVRNTRLSVSSRLQEPKCLSRSQRLCRRPLERGLRFAPAERARMWKQAQMVPGEGGSRPLC